MMVGTITSPATVTMESVSSLETESHSVRLASLMREDGTMNGNMLMPAVATTPPTPTELAVKAAPPLRRADSTIAASTPTTALSGASSVNGSRA